MGFDLVAYDDFDYVTTNRYVESGLTWDGVVWAFRTLHGSNWHPLTWLSLMLDAQLFHRSPGGFHLTNLWLHVVNTVLVFALFRRMTGAHWRSGMVAGLFALHPLHVESVAWVTERKDVLSTFFGLLALMGYVQFVNASKRQSPKSKVWYAAALTMFVFGLMSKPMLVTLPFLLLLLDYWPLNRFPVHAFRFTIWKLIREKIPFLILSLASGVLTFTAQKQGGAVQSSESFSLTARMANVPVAYARYLDKTVWPTKLAFFYPHPGHWPAVWIGLAAFFLIGLTVAAVRMSRPRPWLFLGWFWFLGTLLPVIGLVQVGQQSMADRYTYIPLIGIFIIIAWGLAGLVARWGWGTWAGKVAGAILLWACAVRTADQLQHWRNSETLFRHALAVTDRNFIAHNNLGYYLFNHGQTAEAEKQYRVALNIRPNYADALNNLGHALAQANRFEEAMGCYEAALRADPAHAEARNNLGLALDAAGKPAEAMEQYREVLKRDPENADAHSNLGIALAREGRSDEAIVHLRAAVRSKPRDAIAHNNLGGALMLQKKFGEAAEEYLSALKIAPGYVDAHKNLGFALTALGRRDEAIQQFKAALHVKPDDEEVKKQLQEMNVALPEP